MSKTKINVTSVKLLKGGGIQARYLQHDAKEEISFTCAEPALPELGAALNNCSSAIATILGVPADWGVPIIVKGISLKKEGTLICVQAHRELDGMNCPISLNLNNVPTEPLETSEINRDAVAHLETTAGEVMEHAEAYIGGARAQTDMFAAQTAAEDVED